jgi:hypothetical protein
VWRYRRTACKISKEKTMRSAIVSILLFPLFLWACEGDCMVCHPGLKRLEGKTAAEHAVLRSCKTCHKKAMRESNATAECGRDCWECHDIRRVRSMDVAAHKGLNRCIECHLTLDRDLLRGGNMMEKIY